MSGQKKNTNDYTVAWISALSRESAAVILDRYHGEEEIPGGDDEAGYTFGEIGPHKVVVACLPIMGPTELARCVTALKHQYRRLRFVMLVGVAAGAPSQACDVRLGDVVVSMPGKKHGGIVQYDFGTKRQDCDHLDLRNASHGQPSHTLINAVHKLENQYKRSPGGSKALSQRLIQYTIDVTEGKPDLRDNYRRPVDVPDILFQSDYKHKSSRLSCEQQKCDLSKTVQDRPQRQDPDLPLIHQGVIASGGTVFKDALERDWLAEHEEVICFEMEAAGLDQSLPWLVVRGICDYADSHKNKDWQNHAALIASAYAHELLLNVSAEATREEKATAAAQQAGVTNNVRNNYAYNSGNITTSGGISMMGNQGGDINIHGNRW